jgi:biopolymer transport protein TolR
MKLTPLQKRAERRSRNQTMVDMNLVSLIDVFTILIFFLLSNSGGVEILPSPKAVLLPESVSETAPRQTVVIAVNRSEISVNGQTVSTVAAALSQDYDLIVPLETALGQLKGDKTETRVTIMGDKDIPYRLLRRIMATSAHANFSDVSFAVRQRLES